MEARCGGQAACPITASAIRLTDKLPAVLVNWNSLFVIPAHNGRVKMLCQVGRISFMVNSCILTLLWHLHTTTAPHQAPLSNIFSPCLSTSMISHCVHLVCNSGDPYAEQVILAFYLTSPNLLGQALVLWKKCMPWRLPAARALICSVTGIRRLL